MNLCEKYFFPLHIQFIIQKIHSKGEKFDASTDFFNYYRIVIDI